jgi:hypothetical protein
LYGGEAQTMKRVLALQSIQTVLSSQVEFRYACALLAYRAASQSQVHRDRESQVESLP